MTACGLGPSVPPAPESVPWERGLWGFVGTTPGAEGSGRSGTVRVSPRGSRPSPAWTPSGGYGQTQDRAEILVGGVLSPLKVACRRHRSPGGSVGG